MLPRIALLKAQIERTLPAAFTVSGSKHADHGAIPTGMAQVDDAIGGVPLRALTEICGSSLASSGKTSVFVSLLAQATRNHFCALVDAGDNFDPSSGQAAGITLPRLLWVRCRKTRSFETERSSPDRVGGRAQLPPLEQSFKVADILLQSGGFKLIAVDLSAIPERIVRRVPLSSWFRFSRVVECQSAALVFLTQEPHASSCAGLVLRVGTASAGQSKSFLAGNLLTPMNLNVEIGRGLNKKPVRPVSALDLNLPAQEA
jgi:recombination protein RecA